MKYLNVHMLMYVLLASTAIIFAEDNELATQVTRDCWIKMGRLCADQIKVRQICSTQANLQNICSDRVRAKCASFERTFANSACIGDLKAKRASVDLLTTNTLCAQTIALSLLCTTSIQAQNVCINGNLEQCTCFKGIAAIDPAYTYTLGDPIVFNTILDDPCLNFIQTATEGTLFVAPRDGYYIVDFETNFHDLSGSTVITGVPVVQNTITVNGSPRRIGRYAILTFSQDQVNDTTALLRLKRGDRVGGLLNVLIQDPQQGQIAYQGTATIDGGAPITDVSMGGTLLAVHYLSSECPLPCSPCQTVQCQPVVADCPQITVNCDACDLNCCCDDTIINDSEQC